MPLLVLEREASETYFPEATKRLIEFLNQHRPFWPPVFDYLMNVQAPPARHTRDDWLMAVIELYPKARSLPIQARTVLETLLEQAYSVNVPGKDPRGFIVEYLLYEASSIGPGSRTDLMKDYECSVRVRSSGGRRLRIVDSEATFDVAWLNRTNFAGYECKTRLSPFVLYGNAMRGDARRKLRFMMETVEALKKHGRHGQVYLAGLERNVDVHGVVDAMDVEGFGAINIWARDELEALVALAT